MTAPITPDNSIHTRVPSGLQGNSSNILLQQLQQAIARIPLLVLEQVIQFIKSETGIDLSALQPFLDALEQALSAIVSGDWSKLINVFTNLFGNFLPFDLTSGSFDPVEAAKKFWQLVLKMTGLPVSVEDVLGARLPLTLPFTLGGQPDSLVQWFFKNLKSFLPFDLADEALDIAEAAIQFALQILKPTGVLAWLDQISGILPDELTPQAFIDLLNGVINAFEGADPTGITGLFGDLLNTATGYFSGLISRSNTLASKVTAIEIQLKGSGGVTEDFTGPDAATYPGVIHLNYGPATQGSIGRKNNGLVFTPGFTANDQTEAVIFPGNQLGSPLQKRIDLLRKRVAIQGDCRYWGPLRNNSTTDRTLWSGVYYALDGAHAYFGYMLNGVTHDLTSANTGGLLAPISYTSEDLEWWEFQVGNPAADDITHPDQYYWTWYLKRNDVPLLGENGVVFDLTTLDPGASVLLGANYDYRSAVMTADGTFIFFPAQDPPTEVETITWAVPTAA